MPAILPSGVFRSCQDGSVSRSIVSRIRWIVASMEARVPPQRGEDHPGFVGPVLGNKEAR